MFSTIEINFQNAVFTASSATVTVSNGCFALASNEFLSFAGTLPFDTLNISSGVIGFYNSSAGATVNGTLSIPVSATTGGDPAITVSNFQGNATVSWPSTSGPQYQMLMSGDAMTLVGFAG
jgi:hypothetical protein